MELKNQVISLELARKLKKLGVKQESLWWWNRQTKEIYSTEAKIRLLDTWGSTAYYSAFTVAELGLPDNYFIYKKKNLFYGAWIDEKANDMIRVYSCDKTEANCRAKLKIYLLENGLIN